MGSFGREVFQYLTTVIPFWRVSDEAWPIEDDHFTGIGVLRNHDGHVMVIAWDEQAGKQFERLGQRLAPFQQRIVVVVDDRDDVDLASIAAVVTPVVAIPWSRRAELASVISN